MEIERKHLHDTKKPIHTMITLLDLLIGGDEKNPDLIKYMVDTLKSGQDLIKGYDRTNENINNLYLLMIESYKLITEILEVLNGQGEFKNRLNEWRNKLMEFSQDIEEKLRLG